jgi:hypothetical protein
MDSKSSQKPINTPLKSKEKGLKKKNRSSYLRYLSNPKTGPYGLI